MTDTVASPSVPQVAYDNSVSGPVLWHQQKLDELREQFPFFRSTHAQGFWVLTDDAAIRDALKRPEIFSSTAVTPTEPDPPYKWIPEMVDPPEHTHWRHLLGPFFAPGATDRLDERVREVCVGLIEPLVARGGCDFHADFAQRYPTTIFMEIMGLPASDLEQFLVWEDEILHLTNEEDPTRERAVKAMGEVMGYFDRLIDQRRGQQSDDILGRAVTWTLDGKEIPHEDLLSFCLLMFMAGLDTVTIQLGYSFYHLATHPDDRRRLVDDPSLVPTAMEELLRFYTFVSPSRKVMQDVDFHGCPMKRGDMVLVPLCASTRDPAVLPDADRVVIDRQVNNHIAFGLGPHRCLGSHLARRELRIALEEWHRRIPDYRLPAGYEVTQHGSMYGIQRLHLEWDRPGT